MIKIGKIILKYWYIFIFVILLLSGLFGYNLKNLHQEESENTWFSENDKTFKTYKYFLKEFNLDNFAVVAYNVDDFFTEESIEYQRYLISRFEKINYIEEVVGLTNANTIYSYNDELFIESIFNDFSSERINELINRIEKNPFIKGNLISNDYKTVAVYLKLINSEKAEKTYFHNEVYDDLCRILDEESTKKKIIFHTGGDVITDAEINKTLNKDLMILFPLSVLVSTIILFILFRNLISIITSNIIVVLSIVWTLGFKGLLNNPLTPLSPAILPLINVIAIATCIHLLSHFKLEYNNLNNKNDSLLNTFKKAGIPCFFTSLTTAIGFSSLVVSKISGIKYMGLFSAFGIMVSFILAIILIPLSLKISKIKINNKLQKNYISNFMNKLLKIILKINLKYSLWILIFAFIILIIMFLGIFKINVQSSMIHYLKIRNKIQKRCSVFR